ncbi:rod shape-determining protein MreC [Wohlfahrtiimonas chitiniclastica]|uniref:Cell shape-determining protein MreC n=2 Tax=Wohlfahrtiimonas chitiniclastica TaxID=400946 RepID=L8XZH5_9GAMM|nr:rod shape-determining protein MreC [Wohlfahrtiimonas chitiniclastica]ELV08140.1 Cell shape-determining protein MreC [Wohlfahrtiimonas chitiniclastica SH04]KZS23062.1 rod shape-determining protein MreC [Wohlfahrtiimonas chitiniclastica]KZX37580.1 cell shape-determining protein MreC [Wohlfahrtiimonas chitiniclastica]MBS7815499.1 rod shape-determining protein MreC [Wohlfahrtiimonas chitiniclastica]MBS7817553.1 rod shape-determining protein MreC [Wohlfahrtiimonas chitiniclastica]
MTQSSAQKKQLIPNQSIITIKMVIAVLASVVLLYLDARTLHTMPIKSSVNAVIYPIKLLAELPSSLGKQIKIWASDKKELIDTIEQLQNRQYILEFEVQRNASLLAENRRLRMLLRSSNTLQYPSIIAEIMSTNTNPYRFIVELNRGSNDAVEVHQPIIDTSGVIGQIIEVNPRSSKAILISDPQHIFSVQVNRNGIRGLAQGTGNSQSLNILNIPIDEDIKVGDLLISSGLDQRFPQGYPVAIVTSIEHDPTNHFAKISAKPTAELNKTREVLVLKSIEPDLSPLPEAAAQ